MSRKALVGRASRRAAAVRIAAEATYSPMLSHRCFPPYPQSAQRHPRHRGFLPTGKVMIPAMIWDLRERVPPLDGSGASLKLL